MRNRSSLCITGPRSCKMQRIRASWESSGAWGRFLPCNNNFSLDVAPGQQPAQGPENLHGEVNAIHVAIAQHAGAGNLDVHLRNGAQDFCEALLEGISRCGQRSEERRVGKECRCGWSRYRYKKK